MLKAKPLLNTRLKSGLFNFQSSIYSSKEKEAMSQELANNLEAAFVTLTELLTDFELECTGLCHSVMIERGRTDNSFDIVYRYYPTVHADRALIRRMVVTARDAMRIKERHDQIMQEFQKVDR